MSLILTSKKKLYCFIQRLKCLLHHKKPIWLDFRKVTRRQQICSLGKNYATFQLKDCRDPSYVVTIYDHISSHTWPVGGGGCLIQRKRQRFIREQPDSIWLSGKKDWHISHQHACCHQHIFLSACGCWSQWCAAHYKSSIMLVLLQCCWSNFRAGVSPKVW